MILILIEGLMLVLLGLCLVGIVIATVLLWQIARTMAELARR